MNQVLARDDDVINVAGHRLSTSAIEEVKLLIAYHDEILRVTDIKDPILIPILSRLSFGTHWLLIAPWWECLTS